MPDLTYAMNQHIATITLNRPHRKNAFTFAMLDEWAARLTEAERDPEVRVVVVTGTGGAFCSGVDLEEFGAHERTPLEEKQLLTDRVHQVAHAMDAMSKPVLAAVNGVAVGAGMDMALMTDIRIAGESARFSEGYVRVGLVPGDGGCYYLPRVVGQSTALRLLWTGEFVPADEALRIGLVSAVHPDGDLMDRTYALAATLANRAPVAVQFIKRAVREGARHDLRTALDLISSHQAIVLSTRDSAEARAAFTERREARFEGR
ncbi:enoyl-CoA hydratase/isomerase family protein [Amycolatopsis thermoflava]|uniref:enoyl-CoA hydratase/isomerase family protein n=1 Tax=Amycolatopsis thermoflava TaxID=84480 RepID=UPI003820DAA2